jgi:hypothetical protein
MSSLKSFILGEEVKQSHAERYMLYVDRYHTEVLLDLKQRLEAAWRGALGTLNKTYPPKPEAVQDAQLRNPEATIKLELSDAHEKLISARSKTVLEVAPSFKIPLVYSVDERAHLIKKVLVTAVEVFKKTTARWREIFNYEEKSRLKPWFKITNEGDEVRFQLCVAHGGEETYKTLYAARVEYGKAGTKTRDFDRIYLTSLI